MHLTGRCRPIGWILAALLGMAPCSECEVRAEAPPLVHVKRGLESLSESQKKELWEYVELYALMEAYLNACNAPAHVERRVLAAVRSCVTTDAFKTVADAFRAKVTEHAKTINAETCTTEKGKGFLKKFRDGIEQRVSQLTTACRLCLTC